MWIEVCGLEEIGTGSVRAIEAEGLSIAVFRLADGRLCAIEDRCPHRGARLSRGVVYDTDKVACLDHGWSVRLTDGAVEAPERGCVRTFEVKVEGGVVLVSVN
jgi:nitrite reductase (NADH) small subunit